MFQNITRDLFDNQSDEKVEENKKVNAKDVLNKLFAKQKYNTICCYIFDINGWF